VTKQEKELIKQIENILKRKKISSEPSTHYSVEKASTNNYIGKVHIENMVYEERAKDTKSLFKLLTKHLK